MDAFGETFTVHEPASTNQAEPHHPFYDQRGRRRQRSPLLVPPPPYDGLSVPFTLSMTPAVANNSNHRAQHHSRAPPHLKSRRRPRHDTPSRNSGAFRGRRRYRSPSMGLAYAFPAAATAPAIRKASTRPHTRSSSVASSMRHGSSRPSSPHEWWGAVAGSGWTPRSISRSRGRRGRRGPVGASSSGNGNADRCLGSSPSPSQRIRVSSFRNSVEGDHSMGNLHTSHDYSHHHRIFQARHYTKAVTRRGHCPSRSGSAESYHYADDVGVDPVIMASRRRRRRQRTQSRPRPRRTMTGDSMSSTVDRNSDVFGLTGFNAMGNSSAEHPDTGSTGPKPGDATTGLSRLQCSVLVGESSDTDSGSDAMDVETE